MQLLKLPLHSFKKLSHTALSFYVSCLFALVAGCTLPSRETPREALSPSNALSVSLIQLIANPEKYHGRYVLVTGYVRIGLENYSLCLVEHVLSTQECLWIQTDGTSPASEQEAKQQAEKAAVWKKYHGRVVAIRGTFDMHDTGHLGGWAGAIGKITQVVVLR